MHLTHNKKPTKKEAHAISLKLLSGAELTDSEKTSLVLYFAPPVPKNA